jgi:dolichyl-phosphate-mannose-protein mannosyltransferase
VSAAAAPPLVRATATSGTPAARRVVVGVLVFSGLVALALLAISVVPSAALTNRLLGAAGEARGGANTQELATYLDLRLRLSAALIVAFAVGLWALRASFEELVGDLLRGVAWPARLRLSTPGLVGVPVLVAIGLRVAFLAQPMRYDEALTFNEFASRPLYYGLSFYPDPNNHLLNTLLMHLSYVVLGNQPWVLRLPAFVAGVLLVPATFGLARLLYGQGAAVLAAALVAVSSYIVEYSTNARGYTLQALCFVLLLTLVIVSVRRQHLGALLGAAVVGALGAYTLPTMLYGVAIAAAWALLQGRLTLRHLAASGLILGLITTLLYLPVLVVSGADKLVSNRFVVPLALPELVPELVRSLAQTWAFWNRDVPWPLAVLLLVGFCITLFFELRMRRVPLGLIAPLVCVVLVVAQRVAPFERVWLFLLPLYFVIASAGLTRFVDGRLLVGVFGLVIGYVTLTSGSILASTETGTFPDAEAVSRTLTPRLAPDDAVVTQLPASLPELQYYFPRYGLSTTLLVRPPEEAQNLWIIASPGPSPDRPGWLAPQEVQRFAGATLWELRRR